MSRNLLATTEQRAAFRRASLPVRERYLKMAGPKGRRLLDLLLEAVAAEEQSAGEAT